MSDDFPRRDANARLDPNASPVAALKHPVGMGMLPEWFFKQTPKGPAPPSLRAEPQRRRAGVYGRISTLGQKESSIERQFLDGEDYAERIGCTVVERWVDHGKSGAYWHGRDGIEDAIMAARAGRIDVLIVEHVDRLGRDIGIIGTVYRELTDLGIAVHGTVKGRALDHQDVAMLGLAATEARLLLIRRSRDGRDKMAKAGLSPTGPCYGYDSVPGQPGRLTINKEEAKVVVDIFRLEAEGLSDRQIALSLNARGLKTVMDAGWTEDAVSRVLRNEKYCGRLVWGLTRSTKAFTTGKRTVRQADPSDVLRVDVPEWTIVDRETFDAAKYRREMRARDADRPKIRSTYLLSSKIRCHACADGRYQVRNVESGIPVLYCGNNDRKGTCTNDRYFRMDIVEKATLAAVRELLHDPDLEREYAVAYQEAKQAACERLQSDRRTLESRRDVLLRQIRETFDPGKTVGLTASALATTRIAFSEDLDRVERELDALAPAPQSLGFAPERLRALRETFDETFTSRVFVPTDEAGFRVMAAFRDLVSSVTIEPVPGRGSRLVLRSRLKAMVQGTDCPPGVTETFDPLLMPWRSERVRGRLPKGFVEDLEVAAKAGVGRLTDEQWEHVRPVVPASAGTPRHPNASVGSHDARSVVEAAIFVFTTNCPPGAVPTIFGHPASLHAAIKRLVYNGAWPKIVAILEVHGPDLVRGIPPDCTRRMPVAVRFRERRPC